MSYLLDTNVLSETLRTKPDQNVLEWLSKVPSNSLYISVLTLGEIRKGIEKLGRGTKKNKLVLWLEHDLKNWFGDHVLDINSEVADRWGHLMAQSKTPIPAVDALIAASALVFNLKLVTRNISDFQFPALEVINPWDEG
ncbi:MAG: type II toxin-antitoxin system VapC family toxin [Gammaproteobacteria bacterium]